MYFNLYKALVILVCTVFVGCSSQPWQLAELERVRHLAHPDQSTLPVYELTAAEWVEGQPLLINKDFNFGMAMSMEGVGVAIAAGMRINKNKGLASDLSKLAPFDLNNRWKKHAVVVNRDWRDKEVVIYAMLYGQPKAQLRTIVEFHSTTEAPQRFVDISAWRPIEGDDSWQSSSGFLLSTQLDQSLAEIVTLLDSDFDEQGKEQRYTISGGEAVQRGQGYILKQSKDYVIVNSSSAPNTVIRIPASVFGSADLVKTKLL